MAQVQLVRETESEIYLAHHPLGGVVFAVMGGVFAAIGYFAIPDSVGKWIFTGVGLVFVAVGIGGALWRFELRLDLSARRYTRRKGFWPSPELTEGGLEEIEGVVLVTEQRQSKNHSYTVWVTKLPFRGEDEAVSVGEERGEADGYRRAESLAKRLRMPLLDRTEMPERVTPWEKLDETVADRAAAKSKGWGFAASVSAPPAGSRIQFEETPGRRAILLPAMGMNALSLLLVLFGLMFAAGGGFFLYAKMSGMPVKENPEGAVWVIAPVFLTIGLGVAMIGVATARGRALVREEGDTLAIGWHALGRDWGMKRFAKREIEQVEVRVAAEATSGGRGRLRLRGASLSLGSSASTRGQEVMVRSDREVARLGKHLTDEERQWLRDALVGMASGG
jgi:hypothetical protein